MLQIHDNFLDVDLCNLLINFYKKNIQPKVSTALLGFSNNNLFNGALYDLSLSNWDINSDWNLKKKNG